MTSLHHKSGVIADGKDNVPSVESWLCILFIRPSVKVIIFWVKTRDDNGHGPYHRPRTVRAGCCPPETNGQGKALQIKREIGVKPFCSLIKLPLDFIDQF